LDKEHDRISYFEHSLIGGIELPERFTFPYHYEPHPLAKIAAADLQHYLETQTDFKHCFGIEDTGEPAIGKMFGTLIVQDAMGKIGYLSSFSGKLAESNHHARFVPPVFDMLKEGSFFIKGQEIIDAINEGIDTICTNEHYTRLKAEMEQLSAQAYLELSTFKKQMKDNKEGRKRLREEKKVHLDEHSYGLVEARLEQESRYDKHQLKTLTRQWKQHQERIHTQIAPFEAQLEALKNERKERSAALQQQLFEQYIFLNQEGKCKSLQDIFSQTAFGIPPAGAGECATPKLLQYAFAHGYKPLAMAEFWWGASPVSEIKKHKQFYPACTGKCKPILTHMLGGMAVDDDPFMQPTGRNCELEVVYEDGYLLVVNKPAGLLSVPGIDIYDSVYSRLKARLAGVEPLIVHRLDMDTSGLMVVAKTAEVHKHIQKQFLARIVSKRYTALLSRMTDGNEGEIKLPLCADLYDRPRQFVSFETGKKSVTKWKAVERKGTTTRVHFWPLTGRTHQLRVHAAHELGLNAPIVGDELYGTAAGRLYLHAAELAFIHPASKEMVRFEVREDF